MFSGYDPAAALALTGRGVTVGVNDTDYPVWTSAGGRNVSNSDLPSIRLHSSAVRNPSAPAPSPSANHGTGVLGILAAKPNGRLIRGLAPDADYVYSRHLAGGLVSVFKNAGAEIVNQSAGAALDLNDEELVVRTETGEVNYDATRKKYIEFHPTIQRYIDRSGVLQAATAPPDRVILVFAAGNVPTPIPASSTAHLPLYFTEARSHVLAATAVSHSVVRNPDGTKYYVPRDNFYARCGRDGAEYCITAPVGLHHGWLGVPDGLAGGVLGATSAAAPLVSGALALMKEYFNRMGGLGSHELVARIKDTADKSGIYADEEIYGAGLLDLENALTAQGTLMMRMGESLEGSRGFVLGESGLAAGGAFGDAIRLALGGQTLAAFDKYNAPFPVMSDAVLTEAVGDGRELGEVLRARQAGEVAPALAGLEWDDGAAWFSLNAPGDANFGTGSGFRRKGSNFLSGESRNPYAALAGNGIVAGGALRLNNNKTFRAAMFGENIRDETRTRGALVEWSFASPFNDESIPEHHESFPAKAGTRFGFRPGNGFRLSPERTQGESSRPGNGSEWSFQLGAVEELDGMLRSSGSGVFGALRARTTFAGIHWRSPGMFNNWRIQLAAHAGRTSSGSGTWLSATERLWSGSYALGLERGNVLSVGDSLGFRLRQPLRTEGGFRMRVPTGRTKYGELTWREVSGKPSGRELEFEARYGRRLFGGSWWVSAGVAEDPGHDASAKTEGRGLVGFEKAF